MIPKPRHLGRPYAEQFCDEAVVSAYRHRPPYPPAGIIRTCAGSTPAWRRPSSTNREYEPYDLVEELELRGLFRLEAAADPGKINISRESWLLVREAFPWDELEPIRVKGFDQPVDVFRVHPPKT